MARPSAYLQLHRGGVVVHEVQWLTGRDPLRDGVGLALPDVPRCTRAVVMRTVSRVSGSTLEHLSIPWSTREHLTVPRVPESTSQYPRPSRDESAAYESTSRRITRSTAGSATAKYLRRGQRSPAALAAGERHETWRGGDMTRGRR